MKPGQHRIAAGLELCVGLALLSACASPNLELNQEADKRASPLFAEAQALYRRGDSQAAGEKTEQAILVATDNGRLLNGMSYTYETTAQYFGLAASYYFHAGNIRKAAENWRKAITESVMGGVNAIKKKNEAEETNALTSSIIVGVLGAYGASKAATPEQARQMLDQTGSVLKELQIASAQSIAQIPDGPLPANDVVRIPITVHEEPFSSTYRLKSGGGYCTAFAVSDDAHRGGRVLMTNAHCVTDANGAVPKPASTLTLVHEKAHAPSQGVSSNYKHKIKYFVTHRGQNQGWDGKRENDWAILVVERGDLGFYLINKPIYFRSIAPETPKEVLNGEKRLMLAGYSSDLDKGRYLTLHYGCSAKRDRKEVFDTNCETNKGSSGSPVYTMEKPYTLVGLNAAMYVDGSGAIHVNTKQFYGPLQEVLARESDR